MHLSSSAWFSLRIIPEHVSVVLCILLILRCHRLLVVHKSVFVHGDVEKRVRKRNEGRTSVTYMSGVR